MWSPEKMAHALLLHIVLLACTLQLKFARYVPNASKGKHSLNQKCRIEPTVEECDTILLSWSYSRDSETCDKGYVCADCVNRFETQEQCEKTCHAKTVEKPKWIWKQYWDCRQWLMRGSGCQQFWFESGKNRFGVISQLLYYTGCGPDSKRIFQYDFKRKKCHAVSKPPPKSVHLKTKTREETKGGAHQARQRLRQIIENRTLPPSYSG
uniref:Putative kunitz-like peptide n=1 Tax=Rhipicephalus pulchellus TaxID=72859 RepID=L7MBV6_RHIPC